MMIVLWWMVIEMDVVEEKGSLKRWIGFQAVFSVCVVLWEYGNGYEQDKPL